MPEFSSITLEVNNGGWTDITADVMTDPGPSWNCGIMGSTPFDNLGSPGILTFQLNNSVSNRGGVVGYYSLDHTSKWSGWGVGLPVRLTFAYSATSKVKFYGWIKRDGIRVIPGSHGPWRVEVTAEDWMSIAANHTMRLMASATDQTMAQAVALVLANMTIQPVATSYATDFEVTLPYVFDNTGDKTTAASELQKLINSIPDSSQGGWLYCTSAGTLTYDSPATRGPLKAVTTLTGGTASFASTMSKGMEVSYGKNIANIIKATVYPRNQDTNTVLYTLQTPYYLESGQILRGQRVLWHEPGSQRKLSANSTSISEAHTANALEGGGGADRSANLTITATYGAEGCEYYATATANLWVTSLTFTGTAIFLDDPMTAVEEDATSIASYGEIPRSYDMKYAHGWAPIAKYTAHAILQRCKQPYTTIDSCPIIANTSLSNIYGFLELEPGTKATFSETVTGISGNYYINGYSAQIVDGKHVRWNPVLLTREADVDTYMLLHGDGADDSTEFVNEGYGYFVNDGTGAKLDTAQKKFGTASLWFPTANDWIKSDQESMNDFTLGSGAWTWDWQVRFSGLTTQASMINQYADANNYFKIYLDIATHRLYCEQKDGGTMRWQFYCSWTPVINTWYHVEVVRSGNTPYIFIDGTSIAVTQATSISGKTAALVNGPYYIGIWDGSLGWLDEVRFSRVARHTANFTAPTAAYGLVVPMWSIL